MAKLKLCCGKKPVLQRGLLSGLYWYYCKNCFKMGTKCIFKEDALEEWNKRK